jgi:phospholipid-translocating ATPase
MEIIFFPFFSYKDKAYILFFNVLSLCHTVQVDYSLKEIYQASSPDEFSFIKFCCKINIVYESTINRIRTVKINNKDLKYELLQVLEFDSTRKRMSVIVESSDTNQIYLFCKGAESSMFKCCSTGNIQACESDIKRFAHEGWRTLALAYKKLSTQEYKKCALLLKNAYNDILNRNEMLANAYDEIESDMVLLGATAVEDKLQEKVAETLELVRQAGIKVWVLTGDKKETAVNISNSCKHFSDEMVKLDITDLKKHDLIKARLEYFDKQ